MLCNNLDFVPIHSVDEMLILGLLYEVKKECLKRGYVHL
jgi:hypothetical protein